MTGKKTFVTCVLLAAATTLAIGGGLVCCGKWVFSPDEVVETVAEAARAEREHPAVVYDLAGGMTLIVPALPDGPGTYECKEWVYGGRK